MPLPSPSHLARSLVAAAALLLAAPPAIAAPPKGAPSAAAARSSKDAKGAGAPRTGAKSDTKADAKADKKAAKADKKTDAKADKKAATPDKKTDLKADKKSKGAKKGAKEAASIGAPNKGKLEGAVKLRSSRSLKVRDRAQAWALPDLVKLLQRAAGKVAKRHPKSVMLVGDLSRKSGGELSGHNSHQTGRDADVGLYVANSKGKPAPMTRFVAFDGEGKSEQVKWAQFDDARNWALVEALLTDATTPVRYIFVSNPLRARLLAYAKKKTTDKDLLMRAALVMLSPRDADVHDDHFHVRIVCPESMKATCIEESIAQSKPAPAKAGAPTKAGATAKAGTAAKTDTTAKTDAGAKTDTTANTDTTAKTDATVKADAGAKTDTTAKAGGASGSPD